MHLEHRYVFARSTNRIERSPYHLSRAHLRLRIQSQVSVCSTISPAEPICQARCSTLNARYSMLNARHSMLNARHSMLIARWPTPNAPFPAPFCVLCTRPSVLTDMWKQLFKSADSGNFLSVKGQGQVRRPVVWRNSFPWPLPPFPIFSLTHSTVLIHTMPILSVLFFRFFLGSFSALTCF